MIHVMFCDDDPSVLTEFRRYSEQFDAENGCRIEWEFISDPREMRPGELAKRDILILDIQMGDLNGIDLARGIRALNEHNTILFSTNYLEYALEGYEVAAFRYLKKPLSYEQFAKVIGEAVAHHLKSELASVTLRCGYRTERFRIADIMYCETEGGHVKIVLRDGTTAMANAGIGDLEKELSDHAFFRCHKGCLISLRYVLEPLKNDVRMKDGTLIPVSRHRMKEFMLALMKYWGGQLR